MTDLGTLLGWLAFLLLGAWRVYWFVTGKQAEKVKPKEEKIDTAFSKRAISKYFTLLGFGVVGVQLLGVSIWEMSNKSVELQVLGFFLLSFGLGIAIVGRHNLGTNWANCYEYQIKKEQELVTHGIYKYIRHPLYAGILLFYIGGELIAQSYLVYLFVLAFLAANKQTVWEEQLLTEHFGEKYRNYMRHTKRFIPFIW